MRRLLAVTLLALLTLAVTASPAAADPAGPTHYDSVVTAVQAPDGEPTGVEFEVLGGDAFLVVRAEPGTTVEVPGYEGEPYVRIDPDGVVYVNERSASRWVNDERYGVAEADLPPIVDNDAPPAWLREADGGEYAWHDHRIHYMSPSLPRGVDPQAGTPQPVWDWTVPVVVDGQPLEVVGSLTWVPGPSPVLPMAAIAVLTLALSAAVWRWGGVLVPALAVVTVVAAGVGLTKMVGLPPGTDGEPALFVLPLVAAGAVAVGPLLARRQPAAKLLVPAAGVPLLVWGILQSGALTRPIVPGPLPVGVVRVAVVAAFAVGISAVLTMVRDVADVTRLDPETPPLDRPAAADA